MKKQRIFYAMLLCAGCVLFVRNEVTAQSSRPLTDQENDRIDSLKMSYDSAEMRSQELKDEESISDLKSKRDDSKMQAKEARRIERDANEAAQESRSAYRSEKQAQRSRMQADKQAKKAAKARSISDEN